MILQKNSGRISQLLKCTLLKYKQTTIYSLSRCTLMMPLKDFKCLCEATGSDPTCTVLKKVSIQKGSCEAEAKPSPLAVREDEHKLIT